jgi:hypothetical protein
VPTKTELGNETSADNTTVVATTLSPEEQAKADDMLKLQQKITQELLNSNLKENERNELQVRKKAEKTFSICISLRYFFFHFAGENQQRDFELEAIRR